MVDNQQSDFVGVLEDCGPMTEFEEMVGTKQIVQKYQKLIYKNEAPPSDSSDEPFQFNLPDDKVARLAKKKKKHNQLVAQRKKLTSRELIATHRSRFGGCGVFRKPSAHEVFPKYSNMGLTAEGLGLKGALTREDDDDDDDFENPKLQRKKLLRPLKFKRPPRKGTVVFGSRRSVSRQQTTQVNPERDDVKELEVESDSPSELLKDGGTLKLPRGGTVGRRLVRGSMFNTMQVGDAQKLLEPEGASEVSESVMKLSDAKEPLKALRMAKVDIETIYPQHEKEKEAEKLKRLCDMHHGQKNLHADGRMLIKRFVETRKEPQNPKLFNKKLTMSHTKSPDQSRFLRRIERQAWKFANTQYMRKVQRAEADLHSNVYDQEQDSQFLFGSKGEILFSDDDEASKEDALSATNPVFAVNDSIQFSSVGKTTTSNFIQPSAMKSTFQSSSRQFRPGGMHRDAKTTRQMLEKNYTRQAHITNFMQGINELPAIEQFRPSVKNIKKRESLLLKGQSDELNASFGSDHSSVFKKASENITGKPSVPSSSDRPTTKDIRQKEHIKLQFKMPLAENLILSKQATPSRQDEDSVQQNKSSLRQPNNASVMTAGAKTGTEGGADQFRISFTNFAFVQSLNSSRQSLDEKSALSNQAEQQVPMSASIMIQGESHRDMHRPRIQTQMPQKKSHKRVAVMTNKIID